MKILILFIFFQSHQYDAKLAHQIDSMYVEDQRWRIEIMKIRKKEKSAYSEDTINEMWEKTDSLNELAAKEIVSRYGFPGYDRVGEKGSEHFWAIVQHCDDDVEFQQKILLLMKNELKKNNASKRNYAYLTDRVLVNKGQKQIYGTQCHLNSKTKKWEPLPLKDPAHINALRKSVGLESLADYLKSMN
jgi:hypothetical protein